MGPPVPAEEGRRRGRRGRRGRGGVQGEQPFELSDERMTQTMPSGGAPTGEGVSSPFMPSDEMPVSPPRLAEQRAVLEQAFGSPGRLDLPVRKKGELGGGLRSPFDTTRDNEAYMSPEALERRMADERRFRTDDAMLRFGAGMLGGEDLLSGLGAGLAGVGQAHQDGS